MQLSAAAVADHAAVVVASFSVSAMAHTRCSGYRADAAAATSEAAASAAGDRGTEADYHTPCEWLHCRAEQRGGDSSGISYVKHGISWAEEEEADLLVELAGAGKGGERNLGR